MVAVWERMLRHEDMPCTAPVGVNPVLFVEPARLVLAGSAVLGGPTPVFCRSCGGELMQVGSAELKETRRGVLSVDEPPGD